MRRDAIIMRYASLCLIIFVCLVNDLRSEVYSWTDEKGVRHFSDTPLPGQHVKLVKKHGTIWTNHYGMKFVYLEPGTFTMGSNPDKPNHNPFAPPRKVTLTKGFQIQITEVTREQWRRVMPEDTTKKKPFGKKKVNDDDMPVCNFTGKNAQSFVDELNNLHDGGRYQIPTEAQWEYACRAGLTSEYNWGADIAYANSANCIIPGSGRSAKLEPVGSYPASRWSIYDMHGNAWELCFETAQEPYAMTDPEPSHHTVSEKVAAEDGPSRSKTLYRETPTLVFRGGSFRSHAFKCKASYRLYRSQLNYGDCFGLRIIRIPEDQ